jgi:large subunit ribosomal protein L10
MAKSKADKTALREDFSACFDKTVACLLAEYRGTKAADMTELRVRLRQVNAELRVLNNRIVKKAIVNNDDVVLLTDRLKGPLAGIFVYGDAAAAAKSLLAYAKENELIKVKSGVMTGSVLEFNDLEALSQLPSKEVLLAKILGSIVAPHTGLLRVIGGVSGNLVRVISAIKEAKS